MLKHTDQFYTQLPLHDIPLGDLLLREKLFGPVPADWYVIVTDIKDSTKAVLNGRHENVNLVATGSIVAVLNIVYANQLSIPFFFGGDGATFMVPPVIFDQVMRALVLYQTSTRDNFGFELRTGTVPVADIYAAGESISIAKYRMSDSFSIPVVLGNGLAYAEKIIKGDDYLLSTHPSQQTELDLTGMQCRWDRIAPPENQEEIISLLVVAKDGALQAQPFSKVIGCLDKTYGPPQKRKPISVSRLKMKSTFKRLGTEMRARLGHIKFFELLQTWVTMLYGYIYFRTQRGQRYLTSMVEMSDTLVMDGKINTVISGTVTQRKTLQSFLDNLEASGEIIYGMHISSASIMSCYVRDLEDGHIHFVDGSEGGYTQAARMLKGKLNRGLI